MRHLTIPVVLFLSFLFALPAVAQQATKASPATAKENIREAKRLLLKAKGQLAREGKYDCCIEDACNHCALDEQSCFCHKDLKDGKPVCNECYAGWQHGDGKDKKIDPKTVKTSFSEHDHD